MQTYIQATKNKHNQQKYLPGALKTKNNLQNITIKRVKLRKTNGAKVYTGIRRYEICEYI